MTSMREVIRRWFTPARPLPAGVYHYQSPPENPQNYRLHLRLEPDGAGMLVINAATILHLNKTAAEYAYHLVKDSSEADMTEQITRRYRVSHDQALEDYRQVTERIQTLIETPDLDPQTYLDMERLTPHDTALSAPVRLDCALTYRLPEGSDPAAAPTRRVDRELETAEWLSILDRAWEAGILHIVFTGGEPTLRSDLPELIAHTEANGQVVGLLSDGLRLADTAYLDALLQTGLDHLLLVFNPENELSWQVLENVLAADLFVAVHLTLTATNASQATETLESLAQKGVKALSLSAMDASLNEALADLAERAAELDMALVWDLPVPYSANHPVALDTSEDHPPSGAGRAWLYVEPDGDVLPAQGINHVLGNFLKDSWDSIWSKVR